MHKLMCLILALVTITGCAAFTDPSLIPTQDAPQVITFPTNTPVPTATTAPTATVALPPTITPTPTPEIIEAVGPFRYVTDIDPIGGAFLTQLTTDAEGRIYIINERRAFVLNEAAEWESIVQNSPANILAVGPDGRLWTATPNAAHVYDTDRWIDLPWGAVENDPPVHNILFASNGDVWMATRRDVRRYDGEAWTIYSHQDMTMQPPASGYSDFSFAETAEGDIWVGECTFVGEEPTSAGGGARRFDGTIWIGRTTPASRGCVTEIAQGDDAWVWLDVGPVFWQYSPISQQWFNRSLPVLPEGARAYGEITDMRFDANNDPWPELTLCVDQSCYAGVIRFHFDRSSGLWDPLMEDYEQRTLLVDDNGLLFLPFGVFRFPVTPAVQQQLPFFDLTDELTIPIAPIVDLSTFDFAQTPEGTLYVLGSAETDSGRQVGLWVFEGD